MARVLLVEDDEMLAENIVDLLCLGIGCEVESCINGSDAMAKFEQSEFDLVVLDGQLPDTTGLELLKKLKSTRPNVRVIMMTGIKDASTLEAALDAGAEDVMTKPFAPPQILERIKLLLKNQG